MGEAQVASLVALFVGFCAAGLVASLYRALRDRPLSFRLIGGDGAGLALGVPLLAFAGPAVIMRNTLRGRRYERRKIHFVAIATFIACWWSVAVGHIVLKLAQFIVG